MNNIIFEQAKDEIARNYYSESLGRTYSTWKEMVATVGTSSKCNKLIAIRLNQAIELYKILNK